MLEPMLPPEAPLDMPVQRLYGMRPPGTIEVQTRPHGMLVKRLLLIALTALIGLAASSSVRTGAWRATGWIRSKCCC